MEKIIVAILTWVGDAIQSIFGMIVAFWTSIISGVMIYITRAFLLLFEINDNAFFGEGNTDIIPKMIRDFTPKFRTVAFSVLILIATWHIFKGFFSFLGLGTEPEEAWKIGLKCIMFGILLTFSNSICSIGLQVFDEFF